VIFLEKIIRVVFEFFIIQNGGGRSMYIAEENLKPIVYGFVNDDYESEFGLLRGHYIGDSAECEAECLRVQQEMEDWDDD
jgi:hypothetical protein